MPGRKLSSARRVSLQLLPGSERMARAKSSIGMGSMIVQIERRAQPTSEALEATPPRQPGLMPRQTMTYWTPRAVVTAVVQEMTESFLPPRALRRAEIPVTRDDE